MKKNNKSMIIVIIILLSLSIGFAAFTKDLNITFSESNVNVSGDLDIKFLASDDPTDTSTTINVDEIVNYSTDGTADEIITNSATILSDGTTISGIGVTFNDKDQGVAYKFYIYNNSEYDAYLKGIDFLNYTGAETNKVCTALEGTTQSLVDVACKDIHILIESDMDGDGSLDVSLLDTGSNGFTSIKIPKGEMVLAAIAIVYSGDVIKTGLDDGTFLLPNGDFKINFGDIKFDFSSLEG